MIRDHVGDWIFNYNSIMKVWQAVKREDQHQLFNGGPGRIKATSFPTLLDIINRTNGDIDKINKLLKK